MRVFVPADSRSPREARAEVAQCLRGQVAPEVVERVVLAASELVTNLVQHSPSGGDLTLDVHGDRVYLAVGDRSASVPQLRDRDGTDPGGWGLRIVDQLADQWGAERTENGNLVWMVFCIPSPGARRHP